MTEQLLQRWAQALGGRERLGTVNTLYIRSRIAMGGLTGTVEEWCTAQGRRRESFELAGVYKNLTVFDRGRAWVLDQNGKVRELAGVELEDEVTSTYLDSFAHLVPGRMAGTAEPAGGGAVRFRPTGGRPVTFHLDAQTGLPLRHERPQAERTVTTTFDDWREVEGVFFPWHARQSSGDPQYDIVVELEEVRLNQPVDAAAFAPPAEAAPDFTFATGHSAHGIPIELTSNHIYLQVWVNDAGPLWFLLDTGAGGSCIDNAQARALGLALQGKMEGRGAGEGSTDVALIAGVTFRLPGVEVADQTVAAITLEPLAPFEGRPMHGILGYDFISRFVVEIDYAAGQLHLYDPRHYSYAGTGERLAIFLEGNVPFLHAELAYPERAPLPAQFLLDTGARVALVLNKPFCEAHGLVPARTITAPFGIGVGGETKQYIGRVPRVQLGGVALTDLVAGFSQDVKGAGADPDRAGLIGGEVLRRFTTVWDYTRGQLFLEPNAHFAEPYEYDMSGLLLAGVGEPPDTFRVHRVVADSPAAEAGLQEGDVVAAVDGRPAREYTLEQVRLALKERGRQVRLTVQRAGAEREVVLALRRLI